MLDVWGLPFLWHGLTAYYPVAQLSLLYSSTHSDTMDSVFGVLIHLVL